MEVAKRCLKVVIRGFLKFVIMISCKVVIIIIFPTNTSFREYYPNISDQLARNAIKSYFRTSKIATGGHFVKKKKKYPYGYEMERNAIKSEFRTSKIADQSEMARNAIESDFRTFKMAAEKNCQNCYRK